MTKHTEDTKALKVAKELKNADNWKHLSRWHGDGYYNLQTEDIGDVPVRLFLTPTLLNSADRETLAPASIEPRSFKRGNMRTGINYIS